MHKKLLSLLLICLLMLPCFPALAEYEETFTCGDFEYSINDDGSATITKYNGDAENLIILSELDGHPVTAIGDEAFYGHKDLTRVYLPDSLSSIGVRAFSWCKSLTSIFIPDSVFNIGANAFLGCRNLTLTIPRNSCAELYVWDNCFPYIYSEGPASQNVSITPTDYSFTFFGNAATITGYEGNETMLTVPEKLNGYKSTAIGFRAFSYCDFLTDISLPNSLVSIGDQAFRGCKSLTSISIPRGLTSIGAYAFGNCSSLTNASLPDGLTSIGRFAFVGCESLTRITLPDSLTSIDDQTFMNCSSLTDITLPSSFTSIGNQAFLNCSSLTSASIPDSVTSIGKHTFNGCPNLTLTVPRNSYAEQYAESAGIPYVHPIGPEILIFPE